MPQYPQKEEQNYNTTSKTCCAQYTHKGFCSPLITVNKPLMHYQA